MIDPEEPTSIKSIDTDMGLDLEFDGGFVEDYWASSESIYQLRTGPKNANEHNPPEDSEKPTQ